MDLKEAKYTAQVVRQLEEGQPNRVLDALDWALAERDRLTAENAELQNDLVVVGGAFSAANATLDRLREVVPEGEGRSWSMLDAAYDILYPETEHG